MLVFQRYDRFYNQFSCSSFYYLNRFKTEISSGKKSFSEVSMVSNRKDKGMDNRTSRSTLRNFVGEIWAMVYW